MSRLKLGICQPLLWLGLLLFSTSVFSAKPLVSIVPLFKAPAQLAPNRFTAAIYQITNNTSTLTSFVMQPIAGVTQVTGMYGACQNPIQLKQGESCNLNLRLVGSQIQGKLIGGPIIQNNAAQPMYSSQPSLSDSFNTTITGTPLTDNNWISVLIAQDSPPADLATYMNQIIALAPGLTQIHFRVNPTTNTTSYQTFVQLINLFRTAYSNQILIGFHPDNSNTSYDGWGCTNEQDGACVLNKSIQVMNAINALVDPKQTGQGFNTFSLEQDDVEVLNETPEEFQTVKACLNPAHTTAGQPCPTCTTCTPTQAFASPVVTFGDVTSSYGDGYYGPTMLDFAYPQFYNLGKSLNGNYELLTNGYFPSFSTTCVTPSDVGIYVLDVDTGNPWSTYQIPCVNTAYQTYPDVFTLLDPSTQKPSPPLAAANLAYLMALLTPISGTAPDLNGAQAFITFSGESNFFGSPSWSLPFLLDFYQELSTNFTTLTNLGIISNPGVQPSTLQYALWNFDAILANE